MLLKDGELIIWNYKEHTQYALEVGYVARLLEISRDPLSTAEIDEELLEGGLISYKQEENVIWEWDELSKIFLLGTQNIPFSHDTFDYGKHFSQYLEFCQDSQKNAPSLLTEKQGEVISLPVPDISVLSSVTLWDVLKKRKTSRSFDKTLVSLDTISTLLYATFGAIHSEWTDLEEFGIQQLSVRKSSPSVGGLHCAEAYLFAFNITNLDSGIYHYQSHTHELVQIRAGDFSPKIGEILCGQNFAEDLSFGVAITARLEKCWHKYKHSRALHAILIDIGHLSQTFQLCATGLNLQPWLTGVFSDKLLIDSLKLENGSEYPFFFVGAGYGDGHSLSYEMRELLKDARENETKRNLL